MTISFFDKQIICKGDLFKREYVERINKEYLIKQQKNKLESDIKKMIVLTKEKIDTIFEIEYNKENPHQSNIVISLYKIAFPDYDKIKSISGYPSVSKETNEYLFLKFIQFDKKIHPNVLNGGLWMNNGFSSLDKNVPEWMINTDNVKTTE